MAAVTEKIYKIDREQVHQHGPAPKPLLYKIEEGGCWRVLNMPLVKGTPVVAWKGKNVGVRRWIYALKYGKVKSGTYLRTTCGNTWCVNPDHVVAKEAPDAER